MKAVRIHQYGGREVLSIDDIPAPDIGPDDVLVRVVAASINPVDWKAEFGLDRIVEAHALSESGRAVGKIVLSVGQP